MPISRFINFTSHYARVTLVFFFFFETKFNWLIVRACIRLFLKKKKSFKIDFFFHTHLLGHFRCRCRTCFWNFYAINVFIFIFKGHLNPIPNHRTLINIIYSYECIQVYISKSNQITRVHAYIVCYLEFWHCNNSRDRLKFNMTMGNIITSGFVQIINYVRMGIYYTSNQPLYNKSSKMIYKLLR